MEIPFKFLEHFFFLFNGRKIADNEILKNLFLRQFCRIDVYKSKSIDDIQVTEGKRIFAQSYI